MSTNRRWEDPFDAEHGVLAPSYSSPAPDLFFPANINGFEQKEDVVSAVPETVTPWKVLGV
jgi:hypothetical protein